MSAMDDVMKRFGLGQREVVAVSATAVELRSRREALTRDFTEGQYDLGGLAYEMAIRDHFRLDVLTRRAAALQVIDAELGEVERLISMDQTATSGTCRACGAVHSRGAGYCWQCGTPLQETTLAA